jgi:Kazal-type serine protease inhibitor domain
MTLSTTKTMIIIGLLGIFHGSTATFDCNIGCSLDASAVCGNDGITYPNECFAVCQVSVPVAKEVEKLSASRTWSDFLFLDLFRLLPLPMMAHVRLQVVVQE